MIKPNVVNVKVKYIRPKYNNLKEWMNDPDNVYIGRKGILLLPDEKGNKLRYPPQDSMWANPFKVANENERGDCIQKYKLYLQQKIDKGEITVSDLEKLNGKNIGCWCKEPNKEIGCHGDVIVEMFNKYIN